MPTIFYSWQADRPTREGRNFIERALERAVARISADTAVEDAPRELEVDRDTKGVSGSPPIVDTIFRKIDDAAVFVPDLTFVGHRPDGRPTPNPNVLIEYGWALKSRTHARIVPVMNTAFGDPTAESMPFDMRHLRHPIAYRCPENAGEDERRKAQEALSKSLEKAIRAVLENRELSEPGTSEPVEFAERKAIDGAGRFQPDEQPLGHPTRGYWGGEVPELKLARTPAVWLRLMPCFAQSRSLTVDEIAAANGRRFLHPISRDWSGLGTFRTHEGFATYATISDHPAAVRALAFVFTSGEIWSIDTLWLDLYRDAQNRKTIPQVEPDFYKSLIEYSEFLTNLGLVGPFKWIAGMEDLKGRSLYIPAPPNQTRYIAGPDGQCITDKIIKSGNFKAGESPAVALKPFFQELYNACGRARADWQDR